MAMETTTTSNKLQTALSPDGYQVGQSATDLVGFYGVTPVVQPTSASQAALTITSGYGTASATSGLQPLTSSYNSAIIANGIASIVVLVNKIRADLVTLGILKGS